MTRSQAAYIKHAARRRRLLPAQERCLLDLRDTFREQGQHIVGEPSIITKRFEGRIVMYVKGITGDPICFSSVSTSEAWVEVLQILLNECDAWWRAQQQRKAAA